MNIPALDAFTMPCADLHLHALSDHAANQRMIDTLAAMGMTDANMVAITFVDTPFENNLTTMYDRETCTGVRLHAFGGLYYHPHLNYLGMNFCKQAELLLDMGFEGIKLIEMKPNFRRYVGFGLDSKLYDEMFDMLEARQVPIVNHINDPEYFWGDKRLLSDHAIKEGWWYGDGTCLSYNEIYQEMMNRLKRNPKLKMVFAHFCFLSNRYEQAVELMETYPNVALDITPGGEMFVNFASQIDRWQEFFVKYRDRIYFGSDATGCTGEDYPQYLQRLYSSIHLAMQHDHSVLDIPHMPGKTMRGLALDEETRAIIFRENFYKMLGKERKPLRKDLFEAHTHDLCRILSLDGGNEARIAMLRKNCAELCK